MIAEMGRVLIGLSFVVNIYGVFAIGISIHQRGRGWGRSGKRGLLIAAVLLLVALILLSVAFLSNQFQLKYVATHSNRSLPIHLKFAAVWAGQEGSLLFWAFLQALFTALLANNTSEDHQDLNSWAMIFLSVISVFFTAMTLFFSNPFIQNEMVPSDGLGMNPLLRHPGMIFHPPVLFVGYVGLAIPFAFALSALITDAVDVWHKYVRKWLLLSWIFLGFGLILGARWAYDVLGWGGYWGWDPVENAGLMPWLTGTALLHGLAMQVRGKGFKVWNVILAILSFALVLFGTFATRSGFIQSVHAFSRSQQGWFLLGMIVLSLLGSLVLMIFKKKSFGNLIFPDKVLSMEGIFFFTLLIIMLITLSILAGTLLPTLTRGRFSAPPSWFNRVVGPQIGALMLLMGICPLFGKYFVLKVTLWKKLMPLVLGSVLAPLIAYLAGLTQWVSLIGFSLAGSAGGSAIGLVGFDFSERIKSCKGNQIFHLPITGRHSYAGHLVHLGIVVMAIGIIGTQVYSTEQNLVMIPGDTLDFQDYSLVYEDLRQEVVSDHLVTRVSIAVYRGSHFLTSLTPQMAYYPEYGQTLTEPAILAGMGEDLYLVMFQWEGDGEIIINVKINPLSGFLWLGGLVLLIGGLLAWWPNADQFGDEKSKKSNRLNRIGAAAALLFIFLTLFTMWGKSFNIRRSTGRPLPGSKAPGFSGMTILNDVFTLSEQSGKTIVINFWATWCPQCEDELSALNAIGQDDQFKDVLIVGIAMDDSVKPVMEMASELDITFPMIVDNGRKISSTYGITGVPETFIISPDGTVVFFRIGVVDENIIRQELAALESEGSQ